MFNIWYSRKRSLIKVEYTVYAISSSDIDECVNKPCDQICNNTEGGFVCSCKLGFKLTQQSKCEDIDECLAPIPPCDQLCSNTLGGYTCSCREGFLLNTTTKSNCVGMLYKERK